ncbi:MAG: DUF58 domain-containing protein [Armatimonadota bacterium]
MGVLSNVGRVVFIFGLCFFLIGFVNGSSLMYMVAFICLAMLLAASLFAWYSLRGIDCQRHMPGSTIFSGDPLEGKLRMSEPQARWRMMEIFDAHENLVTGATTQRRMSLLSEGNRIAVVAGVRQPVTTDAGGRRVIEVRDVMRFARRGHYRLGPLTLTGYDPFGLLAVSRTIPLEHDVIVYPRPLPVPEVVLGGLGGRQQNEVRPVGHAGESADFHGIRPYVQGDDLRRVHWKATAHTGKLAIKEYEYRYSGAVEVILDLQSGIHVGSDEFSTLEAAVTLSASVLNHVIGAGNQAGLLATSEQLTNLPQESGRRQLHRALEALALAKDNGTSSLAQALSSEMNQFSRRSTTIVITPTVDLNIIGPLLALRGRSAQVLLVLLNPHSFEEAERENNKPQSSLLSLATKPISLNLLTNNRKQIPTEDDHRALLHAAAAAGLEVFPVGAAIPLHQALQGIRMRM